MSKPVSLWTQNYQQGVSQAGTKYTQGIDNPKRSWAGELTNSKQKMQTNYNAALTSGKFENGVNNVGDAGWKAKAKAKAANYSNAAATAAENYARVANEMKTIVDQVQATVNAMPRNTHQDAMNRMVANATGIRDLWKQRNGGV